MFKNNSSNFSSLLFLSLKLIIWFFKLRFSYFILFFFKNFLKLRIFCCKFWFTIGIESTSSNKYEPPWRSKPRLIFFEKNELSFVSMRLMIENKDKIVIIEYIIISFSFEKWT